MTRHGLGADGLHKPWRVIQGGFEEVETSFALGVAESPEEGVQRTCTDVLGEVSWRRPSGAEWEALRDQGTQQDVRPRKEIDLPEPAFDHAAIFMPAASEAFLVCIAGLLTMVGLRAGTEHLLGKLLAGPVRTPVAMLRIAFDGKWRTGRPDERVGGRRIRVR